ncbi:MAG: YraN family protein [Desulfobulbaceae bacterium]|nr:YraN family protein [Desulfobulbaceae bacterium]HIJ91483.1 YraN family protein [Deltaproteobacteria bacterium]
MKQTGEIPLGQQGETLASRYLSRQGYRVILRNYRTKQGEIDIVAEEQGVLVFVEVKTRRSQQCGHPFEAVTPAKCRQISKAALQYLAETGREGQPARFDVVAISFSGENAPVVELVKNAFDLSYGV